MFTVHCTAASEGLWEALQAIKLQLGMPIVPPLGVVLRHFRTVVTEVCSGTALGRV